MNAHSARALRLALLAAASTPAAAQQLLQTYTGVLGDEFGAALLQTADQNNDGYVDLLVGAPGWNSGRGYIRCLSGRFLATGAGSSVLWTLYSTANAGARFGSSIVAVATLTGDSATDYVVGAPGYTVSGSPRGALMLVDGATHVVADFLYGLSNTRLGESIAAIGDQDGDGKIDLAATSPSTAGAASYVRLISGSAFASPFNSLLQVPHTSINANGSTFYGEELASGFDLDGDGRFDLAIGSPRMLTNGYLEVIRPDSTLTVLGTYTGAFAGEHMGSSIDARHDFDGDGTIDLVVGAPNSPNGSAFEVGRAVVLSGARFLAHTAPFELYAMSFGSVTPPVNHADPDPNFHFGAAVRSCADLNNDGVGEFIVGVPDYFTQTFSGWSFRGGARVYSGATGLQLTGFTGASTDRLGDALLGGFLDLNADGFPEFAVAGSRSDISSTDCGALKFYSLFPTTWTSYCTSKTNSLGCAPSMSASGVASASSGSSFLLTCSSVINQKSGLLMYSHAPNAAPFQGGTLCVKAPLRRTASMNSGGSASGADCTGAFSLDMNARIQSGVDSSLVAGAETFTQYWSRDPASPSQTSLSNAVNFLINP